MCLCTCICVFVFVYLCMRHLVISVLRSLDQELSENIWFVWSKTSYCGENVGCHACGRRTDGRTECEDRARILETEFAKIRLNNQNYVQTVQNMFGQFKMCPYSVKFVQTAQNMSGEHMFFVDGERLLCIFLVRCKRYLRVFHPEDFLVPPGRFRVFWPLI